MRKRLLAIVPFGLNPENPHISEFLGMIQVVPLILVVAKAFDENGDIGGLDFSQEIS